MEGYKETNWWKYTDEVVKELMAESYKLLENPGEHKDYGYIVFPAAKAYEGFLKKYLLDRGVISQQQYTGEHFRIGKALNPNLPKKFRSKSWVFQTLVDSCHGADTPLFLWETWKKARNRVFHFFPDTTKYITLEEAKGLVGMVSEAMEKALLCNS